MLARNAVRLHETLTHRVSGFCRASLAGREFTSNSSGLDFLLARGCCLAVFLTDRFRRFDLARFTSRSLISALSLASLVGFRVAVSRIRHVCHGLR
jgi:hypothetical protein